MEKESADHVSCRARDVQTGESGGGGAGERLELRQGERVRQARRPQLMETRR